MFEQPKLSHLFKSTKQDLIKRNEEKSFNKRKADSLTGEESFMKLKHESTKRIKLESDQKDNEDLGSKSTLCTSKVSSPTNQLELSSKTRGIIDKLLLNINKPKFNNAKRQSVMTANQSILPFLQVKPKDKEPRFSVESKEAIQKPLPLSDKAKEIIFQLKKEKLERINRFLRKPSNNNKRSDSSFSLKFKYEDLLKSKRELLLPPHYKNIFNSFIALDQAINVFKISSCEKTPSFNLVKDTIEQCTYKKFDIKILKRIFYVVPHFYVYYYQKPKKEGEGYEMIINIPSDFNDRLNNKDLSDNFDFNSIQTPKELKVISSPLSLKYINQRKEVFKNILLEFVNKKHENFLRERNHPYFNPFNVKTWHHSFDLSSCDEIPEYQIEPAPDDKQNKVFSLESAIKENNIKEKLISEALSNMAKDTPNDNKKLDDQSNNDKEIKQLKALVSEDFIQRLKAKEEAIKLSKEIIEYSSVNNTLKEKQMILNEILTQMKTLFIVHASQRQSYELNHLVNIIYNSSPLLQRTSSIDGIRLTIRKISKKYPQLLTFKNHSTIGTVVIMNTTIEIPSEIIID